MHSPDYSEDLVVSDSANAKSGKWIMTATARTATTMIWEDYLILGSLIILSISIGILSGCFKRKPETVEMYFFGKRQMYLVPVMCSMISSIVSGVLVTEFTKEIYFHGTQFTLIVISVIPATITLTYFYIPVYFNLRLASAFQYFELRFRSRAIRVLTSFLGIVSMVGFITLVMHGTSMVFSRILGFQSGLLATGMFFACILPTTMSGFKGTLWTGALQAIVLLTALSALVAFGAFKLEDLNLQIAWEHAVKTNRVEFLNMDVNPKVRHTFWTSIVGGYFVGISFLGATQSQIQRFCSVPTIRKARMTLTFGICLLIFATILIFISGLLVMATNLDCSMSKFSVSPLIIEILRSTQFLENFLSNTFENFPGIQGLIVTGIICSALSSISSGWNSLACTATNDYFVQWIPNISEDSLVFISKALTVLFGCLTLGLVFVAENVDAYILQTAWQIFFVITAVLFGAFTLGMFFPWANSKGVLLGIIASLSLTFYAIFLQIQLRKGTNQNQIPISKNCTILNGFSEMNNTTSIVTIKPTTQTSIVGVDSSQAQEDFGPKFWAIVASPDKESFLYQIAAISPMWFSCISCILTVFFGLFFSLLFVKWERNWRVRPDSLSTPFLKFWFKCFPTHMKKWVEPDENLVILCSSSFSVLPMDSKDYKFKREPLCDVQFTPI